MYKHIIIPALIFLLSGCAVTRKLNSDEIEVSFLDEYVIPQKQKFEDTQVGGLSGIEYDGNSYFLICDQSSNPRIYKTDIKLSNGKIDTITFSNLILITKPENISLDLESVRILPNSSDFLVSSEGYISNVRDPGIYKVDQEGEVIENFTIPEYFKASGINYPRNNGVFEGLSLGADGKSIWVTTELPLKKDGATPKLWPTKSFVRFTKFDLESKKPINQFAYKLDGISKLPINYFAINGVTEILEYEANKFLVLERAFSAGYGSKGNTVKIFQIDASNTSSTLAFEQLRGEKFKTAQKKLIFNFKSVRKKLTDNIIDNIEGMTLGPRLQNGNQSLILISDNNFNSYGKQLNQVILLEINFKK